MDEDVILQREKITTLQKKIAEKRDASIKGGEKINLYFKRIADLANQAHQKIKPENARSLDNKLLLLNLALNQSIKKVRKINLALVQKYEEIRKNQELLRNKTTTENEKRIVIKITILYKELLIKFDELIKAQKNTAKSEGRIISVYKDFLSIPEEKEKKEPEKEGEGKEAEKEKIDRKIKEDLEKRIRELEEKKDRTEDEEIELKNKRSILGKLIEQEKQTTFVDIEEKEKKPELPTVQQGVGATQLKPIEKPFEKEIAPEEISQPKITPSPEVTEPIIIAQEPEMTPRKPLGTPLEKAKFKQFEREETTPVWVPQPKISETPLEQIGQAQKEVQRQGRGFLGRGIEFGNRAYRTGRRMKKASSVIKSLAKFGAKTGGKTAVKAGAAATIEFWGPVLAIILVAIIILVFFLGLFILLTSGNPGSQDQQNPPPGFEQIPGLSISFTGPFPPYVADNTVPIVYNGTVTYNPPSTSQIPASSITIFDQIPSNAVYQSATGCSCSDQNCTLLQCPLTGSSMNFQITLKARENNIWVLNKVYATTSYSSPGGEAPNANTCNGKYDLQNPLGQNFGDPSCSFVKDNLYTILKQQDPRNADLWFFTIVRDESHYDPNSFTDCSTGLCTPDSQGAWGLFQMGRGKNGNLDHGDVSWQIQTSNAVSYNKQINCSFRYWSTAMAYWDTRLCP